MNKLTGWIHAVRDFFGEVKAELLKCNWPSKPELWESTIVVMVSVAIVTVAVSLSDLVLMNVLRLVIR